MEQQCHSEMHGGCEGHGVDVQALALGVRFTALKSSRMWVVTESLQSKKGSVSSRARAAQARTVVTLRRIGSVQKIRCQRLLRGDVSRMATSRYNVDPCTQEILALNSPAQK